jgi:hypothetical protein
MVTLEHIPLGVALQQDVRALHQIMSVMGYGEHAAFVMAAVVKLDRIHRHTDAVPAVPGIVVTVV